MSRVADTPAGSQIVPLDDEAQTPALAISRMVRLIFLLDPSA
jgi:hypothetical protein